MSTLQKVTLGLLGLALLAILGVLALVVLLTMRSSVINAQHPVVVISGPPVGATVPFGQDVSVLIEARDERGVTRIELQVDGQSMASQSSSIPQGQPHLAITQVWQPKAPGQHVLVAWAYDAHGAVGNSAPVDVIVAESTSTPGPTPVAPASLTPETTPIPPEPNEEEQIAPIWEQLTNDWANANWPAALADLERVVAIDPNYDDIRTKLYATHVNYGNALLSQGNKTGATQEYMAALAVNPSGPEALQALQRLQPQSVTATPTATPNPNVPLPVVQILAPARGTRVGVGQTVAVSALASGSRGVGRAELWVDGGQTPYATVNNPNPKVQAWNLSFSWKSSVLGYHTLIVRAYDASWNHGDSTALPLQVVPNAGNPKAWITQPGDGARMELGQTVRIEGVATDDVGIVRMEVWLDGGVWQADGSPGQSPMYSSHTWRAGVAGKHKIKIRAIDTAGAVADSGTITMYVNDTAGPSVRIDAPSNGITLNKGAQVTVQSTALDNAGITKVNLFVDAELVRTDVNPNPRQQSWTVRQGWAANIPGQYLLTTVAYDTSGKTGTSQHVVVNVKGDVPPTPAPDLSGYWFGQGNRDTVFFLNLAQHGPALDGTCYMDTIEERLEGSLYDSVVGGKRVVVHADFPLGLIGVQFEAQIKPSETLLGGHDLVGTYTLTSGESGSVTFRRSGPPPPHPVVRPTDTPVPMPTFVPEPTEEPFPTFVPEPTEEPFPTFVPEPTEEPFPTYEPEPTDEPQPTDEPTYEPTYEPTDEPTYEPEPTDEPQPTDEPTYEPEPTDEPQPTDEPEPTYAPEPPDEPMPGPDEPDYSMSGNQGRSQKPEEPGGWLDAMPAPMLGDNE